MSLNDEQIAELIAQKISEHRKEKSWFMKLSWMWKVLISIPIFISAISVIATSFSWINETVNHEKIQREKALYNTVYNLVKMDSTIIKTVNNNTKNIDTLKRVDVEGAKYYAVGYRAEKMPDGSIVKYYRGWDGKMQRIYPDPIYSTSNFTYWFYNTDDGEKEYTFGK